MDITLREKFGKLCFDLFFNINIESINNYVTDHYIKIEEILNGILNFLCSECPTRDGSINGFSFFFNPVL